MHTLQLVACFTKYWSWQTRVLHTGKSWKTSVKFTSMVKQPWMIFIAVLPYSLLFYHAGKLKHKISMFYQCAKPFCSDIMYINCDASQWTTPDRYIWHHASGTALMHWGGRWFCVCMHVSVACLTCHSDSEVHSHCGHPSTLSSLTGAWPSRDAHNSVIPPIPFWW